MKEGRGTPPPNVDAYLATIPPPYRAALQKLRRTVQDAAPKAEEVISYGMPAFRHHGALVYYAAFRDHCSFFVGSQTIQRRFAAELKPFAVGRGTIRFTLERPLPAELVRRIVKARVAENEARAAAKPPKAASRRTKSRR